MTPQQLIGNKGEDIATNYLIENGYVIKDRNWRFSRAEVDIIAEKSDVLVFVEVKTKTYDYYGRPEESIDSHKERMLYDAAAAYMVKKEYEWEFRFDIISVILRGNDFDLEHFEDAFFPGV